uniref:RPM1-interacting protein 4-like n=1 Tax=Cicer arietinum TaxID=3827 RepID=A0A3Q7Y727_CICAR|nr:RPM1-interacting protein 4-like [Cicer arietinum]
MAHSHVPKFGNWEADNIPYSACFENARREKAGIMMNPTDPMKNPKAFNKVTKNVNTDEVKYSDTYSDKPSSMEKGSHEVVKNNSRRHLHRRRRGSKGSFTSEFGSEKGDMDHFVVKKVPQSDHKRSVSKGVSSNIGSFSSTSHSRHNKSGSHSFNEHREHRETAIPEFGKWDVKDPNSGEGYTVIFSKIKEERKIMSSNISGIRTPPPLNNCSNTKNQYGGSSFSLSKVNDTY